MDQAQRVWVASFISLLTTPEMVLHEAGRSGATHIADWMCRMELAACRSLSTYLHAYNFFFWVHLNVVLFDRPDNHPAALLGGYRHL
jgi:hypothetical protein